MLNHDFMQHDLMQHVTVAGQERLALSPVSADVDAPVSVDPVSTNPVCASVNRASASMSPVSVVPMPETVTTGLTIGGVCTNRHGVHTGGFEAQAAEYHATGKGLVHGFWAPKAKADHFQRWKSAM
jgi:hypothetical protein